MTTEELDALDALLQSTRFGPVEVVDVTEIWRISATSEDVVCDCAESKDADFIAALVNAAPRLLAEARQVATLRAKLIESETWRTELRQEMDAVKGKLRDVTGQRDELREAATDHAEWHGGLCDNGDACNSFSSGHRALCAVEARLAKALEAAR